MRYRTSMSPLLLHLALPAEAEILIPEYMGHSSR